MILTIVAFVLVLSVLVFVHELGHFGTARYFGIKSEEFGLGFPPRFLGYYKNLEGKWKMVRGSKQVEDASDTIYSLNYVPLGGFVKIKGEDAVDGAPIDPDSFIAKPIWQRSIVISAGVTMNMILAAVLLSIGLMFGIPQALDGLSDRAIVTDRKVVVAEAVGGSPAEKAGIKVGDIIESADGQAINNFQELQKFNEDHVGKAAIYLVKRGDQELGYGITPEIRSETGKGGIGIAAVETGLVSYPWYWAPWEGLKQTYALTVAILKAFGHMFYGIFTGQGVSADVAGPVGIAALTGQVARMGIIYLLQFTALLSINLAIINFLPIPALDGGRLLFMIIEKIKGRPVKRELETAIHNIGFVLLMVMVVFVTYKDLAKYAYKFVDLWHWVVGLF
jgi:regulator of sigma E protease